MDGPGEQRGQRGEEEATSCCSAARITNGAVSECSSSGVKWNGMSGADGDDVVL